MALPQSQFPPIGSVAATTDELPEEPDADAPAEEVEDGTKLIEQIESLCMSCGANGTTRLLLTMIPYFREVIIMSFSCEHCGASNNEVQSAGRIQDQGVQYTVSIRTQSDLGRQIVKSPSATIEIPEFEFTVPAGRGQLTSVEGVLRDAARNLSINQPLRKVQDDRAHDKIQSIIDAFLLYVPEDPDLTIPPAQPLKRPFTVLLNDPAGNSIVEFLGSLADPQWSMSAYQRTDAQNVELGIGGDEHGTTTAAAPKAAVQAAAIRAAEESENPAEEIFVFPGACPSCMREIDTLMKKVTIPYFKDIFIMSTNCDMCGYRDNEVKSGSAVSDKGRKITLLVESEEDLSRDVLKSETCGLAIPEIELVLEPGTLGGRFTTLEGILDQIYDQLNDKVFASEDGVEEGNAMKTFLRKLKELKQVKHPFTVVLDDPLANSYLQNLYAPDPDPNMQSELYERAWDQNEELGLNDMELEGYEEGGR